jgi:hypothetical protein
MYRVRSNVFVVSNVCCALFVYMYTLQYCFPKSYLSTIQKAGNVEILPINLCINSIIVLK